MRLDEIKHNSFKLKNGNTISMSPKQFLELAMPFGIQGGPVKDSSKITNLARTGWTQNPILSVKETPTGEFQVGLHDGRHRAEAAILRGDNSLDVDIIRGKKFAREHPEISDSDLANLVVKFGLNSEI
jgi:hypothetical protein